jgi:acyl-homoserine-lactone acylase
VGGCDGVLGCFRVLWFVEDEDGLRRIRGGDGWVFAVEFTDPPRAYTVLAYGQSDREDSPHHTDQLRMFVEGRMKPIAFTEEQTRDRLLREYRPGVEPRAVDGG